MSSTFRLAISALLTGVILSFGLALAPNTALAVGCQKYTVLYNNVEVHENPWDSSVVRKIKNRGDVVTGPGRSVLDQHTGIWFTAVFTSAATDGEGWIRSAQLSYPRSC